MKTGWACQIYQSWKIERMPVKTECASRVNSWSLQIIKVLENGLYLNGENFWNYNVTKVEIKCLKLEF